jgi:uncharacterized protein (DUF1697 family)
MAWMSKVLRYAAFLRGVSPMNCKMADLKRCFEGAGFKDVKTVLASGNVVFSAAPTAPKVLERKAEAGMDAVFGRTFMTIVRPIDALAAILGSDPYAGFQLESGSKRIVTFLRKPPASKLPLPIERDGARILSVQGNEVFSAYVRSPRGPVFMVLIEKTFGQEVTTRTWETVAKMAAGRQ